jgi:hypothetical protein
LSEEKPLWRKQQNAEQLLKHNENYRALVSNLLDEKQSSREINEWIFKEYGDRFGVPER